MTYVYDLYLVFGAAMIALVPIWLVCATICAVKDQIQDFIRFCKEGK